MATSTRKTLTDHLAGSGVEAVLARYLAQHGAWRQVQHRHSEGTTVVRELDYCACPICTDARAILKLED